MVILKCSSENGGNDPKSGSVSERQLPPVFQSPPLPHQTNVLEFSHSVVSGRQKSLQSFADDMINLAFKIISVMNIKFREVPKSHTTKRRMSSIYLTHS